MSEKARKTIRVSLFVVAAAFTLWGIWRGEVRTVFVKASNICLECIGIG
jgi:hypothetical protein